MKSNIKDTKNLECNLIVLIEHMIKDKDKSSIKDIQGYYKLKNKKINSNFSKKNFTLKKYPILSKMVNYRNSD